MARQTMTLACTASAFIDPTAPNTNKHGAGSYNLYDYLNAKRVLLGFDAFPANLGKKIIYSYAFAFSGKVSQTDLSFSATGYPDYFDETSVTQNNWAPGGSGTTFGFFNPSGTAVERFSQTVSNWSSLVKCRQIAVMGVFFSPHYGTTAEVYTRNAAAANRPVITIEYDDTTEATSKVSVVGKTSGYLDPEIAQTFSWGLIGDPYQSADPFVQTAATFSWSSDGGTTWNDVQIAGSTQSVTIPANTFPRGSIQWKVTATDDRGATTSSGPYTLSTADQVITPTPLSPSGSVVSGSEEIPFLWSINSPSGTAPSKSRIFYKLITDNDWTYIDITGPATSYTLPAGTLSAGTYVWGLFVWNQAEIASAASQTVQFISIAPPAQPIVTVEAVPFATIRWQADGQTAWRVTVDGTVYGPYFGTQKSFTLPDYLPDGEHTAQVEVQGSYGLWSQAGQVSFTVTNAPGDAIQLSGVFYRDAALSWETESQTADFLIYRDGVRIGHTTGSSFTDRVTLGQHSWQVINRLPGGFYTASNAVEGELKSCGLVIAPLSGGEWLDLTKSASSTREISTTISQTASIRHFAGETWPSAEVAPYRDQAVAFDVAWLHREKTRAAAFEALIGQTVILKAPDGSCVVGLLSAVSRKSQTFFRAYTATVTRVKWRDYIDADR